MANELSSAAPPPLTAADLDRLAALHEAAAGKAYTFRKRLSEDGRKDLWAIDGAAFASDAEVMCAARNALPSLLALARRGLEAEAEIAHARDGEQRARERFEERANHYARERDGYKRQVGMVLDAVAKVPSLSSFKSITLRTAEDGSLEFVDDLSRAESAESKLAAALAEVERVRAAADELDEAAMCVIHSGDGVGRFEVAHAEYVRIAARPAAPKGGPG